MNLEEKVDFSKGKKSSALGQKILNLIKKYKKTTIALAIFFAIVILLVLSIIYQLVGNGSSYKNAVTFAEGAMDMAMAPSDSMFEQKSISKRSYQNSMPLEIDQGVNKYDKNIERKIIKNGNLSLVVKDIKKAKQEIENITSQYHGFIQSANFSENEYKNYNNRYKEVRESISRSGYFDVKIPSKDFKAAFGDYKKVALKIENESISASDVTEQYLDLETQIKNKQAEEDQYRIILKRSGKISDVLEVTKYLNSARKERERLQGRLNYLSNQVELSSIRINIVSEKDVEILGIVWSPLKEVKAGFRNLLEDLKNLADEAIAFTFKLPILLMWLVIIFYGIKIGWKILVSLKKKIFNKKNKNNQR